MVQTVRLDLDRYWRLAPCYKLLPRRGTNVSPISLPAGNTADILEAFFRADRHLVRL